MSWQKVATSKRDFLSYVPLVLTIIVTIIVSIIVYKQSERQFKERLRERLSAVAATATLAFDAEVLNRINTADDLNLPELKVVTAELQNVRIKNPDTKFIYILRKTKDPNTLVFVADADMLSPIDWNKNGLIDEEEVPPSPGEEYDISEIPQMKEAFSYPTADTELVGDGWGTYLSGYAPIYDNKGSVVAILGMDVEIKNFYQNVQVLLVPFILLSSLLMLMLTTESVSLIRIWNSRVELFKELDRQKDTLISIVSHQLSTPITSVKWYIEMLLDGDAGKITQEQEKELKTMQSVTGNLSDLVSMLLDVSRIQLGRMKVDKIPLKLDVFFEEILSVIRPKAEQKKQHFTVTLPKHFPEAELDKRLTRMILENLLSNAVKYTPEGGRIALTVSADSQSLRCDISDSGIGIPQSEQPKLFEKLFRASNVRSVDGNGLGLFVAKGAVEAQGGTVSFVSKEGRGTTFTVSLPLNKEPASSADPQPKKEVRRPA
jgi:signal transduction histidine kinase